MGPVYYTHFWAVLKIPAIGLDQNKIGTVHTICYINLILAQSIACSLLNLFKLAPCLGVF